MASKVNMRFVMILGVALSLALAGVVVTAYFAVKKTGEQNVALGDEAAAKGEWERAAQMYANAVAKNSENVEWINKWIGAMEKTTPDTPQKYREAYENQYLLGLRGLASADRANAASVCRYLEEELRIRLLPGSGGLQTWESMNARVEQQIRFFRGDDDGLKKLRRYRGLARMETVALKSDPAERDIADAEEDLRAALSVEPNDETAVLGLARLSLVRAAMHQRRNERTEMAHETRSARETLDRHVAAHPPAPGARLALLQLDLRESAESAPAGTTDVTLIRQRRAQVQQLVDAVLAERPERLNLGALETAARLATIALDSGNATADMMMTQVLQGRPNDPQVLLTWAALDMARGNHDRALTRLQQIVDLQDLPLSLAGRILHDFRGRAVALQANVIFEAWERATDSADKQKQIERMDATRAQLARFAADGDSIVQSVDARREYMAGRLDSARRLLADYNERTGASDPAAVHILGDILATQGNMGAARRMYERSLELNPRNVRAMRQLAAIAAGEQDFGAASRYLTSAVALMPDDQGLAAALADFKQRDEGEKSTDPVVRILHEVRTLSTGVAADRPAAMAKLRTGLATYPSDLRLHFAVIGALAVENEKEPMHEAVRAALVHHPDNPRLRQMDRVLSDPDPVASQLQMIAEADAPEHRKALARATVFQRAGRAAEAAAEVDRAASLAPDDAEVFEARFSRALAATDETRLRELVEQAESKNLDGARGAIARARRDLALISRSKDAAEQRASLESVATTLRATLAQDRLNFAVWRMLGAVQVELGHEQAAVESLARAFEIRPTDPTTATMYIGSLMEMRSYDRGLEVARRMEPLLSGEPRFDEALIQLESFAPGGDRTKAIAARRQIAQRQPTNAGNLQALALLLINSDRSAEAVPVIESLRALNPRAAVATEARLLGRNRAGDAVALYRRFIESLPAQDRSIGDYVGAARFMQEIGRIDDAVAILREGVALQSPDIREIDRSIADLLFAAGRFEEASRFYGELLRAGIADAGDAILLRAVECELQRGRFDAADEMLTAAAQRLGSNTTFLILQAQAAAGKKEADRARRLLDRAVAASPETALVYLKRAEFASADPARARDVEADLEQVLRLEPSNIAARRMLATHYFRTSRTDLGVDQMRRAMAGNPDDESIRLQLIDVLQALGRSSEALDIAEDSLKRFTNDNSWRIRTAQLCARYNRWERAAAILGEMWDREQTPELADHLAFALTNGANPDMNRAIQVLSHPAIQTEETPRLLLSRARVYALAKRPEPAMTDILAAWAKTNPESAGEVGVFFKMLGEALPEPKDQLAAIGRIERRARMAGWGRYFSSAVRMLVPDTRSQGESDLRMMAESGEGDTRLRVAVWRAIGTIEYQNKRFEEALTAFRRGLSLDPEDAEMNNNVAFTLGVDLKRPTEALPFAEKAAEMAPAASMILDTLGAIYQSLGRHQDAAPILERALNYGTTPAERVPAALHLAAARKALGDRPGARQLLIEAERMIDASAAMRSLYDDKLKDLRRSLDSE
ncbi:MAG: tetratricopeptide repeat protein [Phycisphaeraceae bacterium]|nr:tetratricopeptide repeat protein [Phycisphaeraceae bacterium]